MTSPRPPLGTPPSSLLGRGAPVLLLALALVLTLLLGRSYAIQSDEGYTLNAAWQLWNGMRMYDDFRHFVGPGSGYSVYLLWKILGSPSYLAARLLSLALSFSSTVAMYLMLKRLGLRGMGLAFSIFAWLAASSLYVPLNHNPFSSFAATWFLLLFLRIAGQPQHGRDRPSGGGGADAALRSHQARFSRHPLRDHALVGVAAGTVFLFLQTKGLFLVLGAVAFAFAVGFKRRDYRPVSSLAGGFIGVVAPLFLLWSPAVLIRQWFIIPLTGHYLRHTGASGLVMFVAVALICGMGWIALRRRDPALTVLAVTQAALLACMSHNMEINHLAINGFPAILFIAVVVHDRLERRHREEKLSAEMTMAIVVAVFVATLIATPAGRGFFASSTFAVDILGRRSRGALFGSRRVGEAHAIYAGPFLPGLYFELEKKNPYFVSETIVCDDACQRQLVAEISATKPELAFLHYGMVRHLSYDPNSPVDVYLRERYVLCRGDNHGEMIVRAIDPSWCP
jgi:hypothetical protein